MHLTAERRVAHALFTPLLIGSVSAATVLCLVLVVLFYKYLQVRETSFSKTHLLPPNIDLEPA